jgi:hypothetical protein
MKAQRLMFFFFAFFLSSQLRFSMNCGSVCFKLTYFEICIYISTGLSMPNFTLKIILNCRTTHYLFDGE